MAGAFCIFGVSRSICKKVADKKTPTTVDRRDLSIEEWAEKRDAMAEELFNTATRLVRVSPELDTPHFCRDWLAADPGNVRDAVLMVRGPKRDKEGNPVMKNGAPVETWLNYEDECKRLKIPAAKLVLPKSAAAQPVAEPA
jgi:hypothetical protein